MHKPKNFEIRLNGKIRNPRAVTSKDIILSIIKKIGTSGGNGCVIEYRGPIVSEMTMEQRMTICNMSIEAGARAGLMCPDERTFEYIKNKPYAPQGRDFEKAIEYYKLNLFTDPNAKFHKTFDMDIDSLAPQVSWGTNPSMVADVTDVVPPPEEYAKGNENAEKAAKRALEYMNLQAGTPITDIKINRVFIGSCTNSRLEDLIEASIVVKGKKVHKDVRAMVVPGSQQVKLKAESLGLDRIFIDAGFEWRESGCSMCLGMNPDILSSGERCASTSNRNFEGRQGSGGRTHLVSPIMAGAAAVAGHFVDIRDFL
jgi:3-isopropylmalate/(R)-2-methylmalate dehydratase large subunit